MITSLSTRFLGQPRLMKPTFKRVYRPYGRISLQDSISWSGKRLLWRAAGFEVHHSFFNGGEADIDVRLVALDAVEAGEVATGEGLQAVEDFSLHVAHDFGEAVDDSLLRGVDSCCEVAQSRWPVFGCHRRVVSHGAVSPNDNCILSVARRAACRLHPAQVIIVGHEIISHRRNASGRRPGATGPLDREDGQRMVCQAALAGGEQLPAGHRDQPARDVAGRYLRPGLDRYRTELGRGFGDDHDAGVPARSAVEAGFRGLPTAHR